jgi:hypothetical protein
VTGRSRGHFPGWRSARERALVLLVVGVAIFGVLMIFMGSRRRSRSGGRPAAGPHGVTCPYQAVPV